MRRILHCEIVTLCSDLHLWRGLRLFQEVQPVKSKPWTPNGSFEPLTAALNP